jgi:DNA modification methylase
MDCGQRTLLRDPVWCLASRVSVLLIQSDARQIPLADKSIHCVVTSPPYWGLRDYGVSGQLGLEKTPEEYIAQMVQVFREVWRVLREDGTLWLNLGDSYSGSWARSDNPGGKGGLSKMQASNLGSYTVGESVGRAAPRVCPDGLKPKDLIGIPWMLAFALRSDGWYLRSDIIWSKPNPMPESVTDRPTKAHEYIFLLSKSERYYYDADAILEPVSPSTHMRVTQDIDAQVGSARANGGAKTNGNMKAVLRKQDAVGKRTYTGFNEKWKNRTKDNDRQEQGLRRSDRFGRGAGWRNREEVPLEQRNKRSVWTVNVQGFSEAHFATFPEDLIKPCILAGCPAGGTVLDPFSGSGTTALVARNLQCNAVGLELNPAYIEIAKRRLSQEVSEFA